LDFGGLQCRLAMGIYNNLEHRHALMTHTGGAARQRRQRQRIPADSNNRTLGRRGTGESYCITVIILIIIVKGDKKLLK